VSSLPGGAASKLEAEGAGIEFSVDEPGVRRCEQVKDEQRRRAPLRRPRPLRVLERHRPIDASSGDQQRHRLSRAGNRRINRGGDVVRFHLRVGHPESRQWSGEGCPGGSAPDKTSRAAVKRRRQPGSPEPWGGRASSGEALKLGAVIEWHKELRRSYGLDAQQVALVARSINDTYRVESQAGTFALRVYRAVRPWAPTDRDLAFELTLLDHFSGAGISVPRPVRRIDGTQLGRLDLDGVSRTYALFTWMPGRHVDTDALTRRHVAATGQTLASIHCAGRDLSTRHPRPCVAEEALIDRPLARLAPGLRAAGTELRMAVEAHVDRVRHQLAALDRAGGRWGIVHGDPQVLNFLFDDDGQVGDGQVTVIDFDHCGYGWLMYDVAYYWSRLPDALREPFLASYHDVRPLAGVDLDALPVLARAAWIREGTDSGNGLPLPVLVALLDDPRV
jgi:Ser/Thr protein kinase RdoA (MazF antagonist)